MLRIGCHLSVSKGFLAMGREALRIGANTFQFFTRNPRGGAAKDLRPDDVAAYNDFARENDIAHILAHASYTLNPASLEDKQIDFVRRMMTDDLDRLRHFPGAMYNFHPGQNSRADRPAAIGAVVDNLDHALARDTATTVLLETMSGKGSEVGGRFEELRAVMDGVRHADRLGVCLDTCHVFDAGYDIVGDLDGVLKHFDAVIGLERLKAVHLNDSKNSLGSHKDRHAKIGEGAIGWDAFARIINHPALRHLPFFLETPNDVDGYAAEIAGLKERYVASPAKAKTAAEGKAKSKGKGKGKEA